MAVQAPEVGGPSLSARRTLPPLSRNQWGLLVAAVVMVAATIISWIKVQFGLLSIFSGIGDIFRFLGDTVPPHFHTSDYSFRAMLNDALTTVCMALVGTAVAVVLSVPMGFLAARNTTPHPVVRWIARAVIGLCRSTPALVLAVVFRDAIGIGVLPGVLALGIHSIGMLGKVYADGIESVPDGPREAMTANGASRLQTIMAAVLPPALPTLTSTALYRLDINLRESVILGYVGAGGIGFALESELGAIQFRPALGVIIVIAILCLLMELLSAALRSALIGAAPSENNRRSVGDRILRRLASKKEGGAPATAFDRDKVRQRLTPGLLFNRSIPVITVVLVCLAYWKSAVPMKDLLGFPTELWKTLKSYFPPDFHYGIGPIIDGMLQSLEMAVVGTAVGVLISIPIALLAARNIANPVVYQTVRILLVLGRSVPELIMAIVFSVALGPGPAAGVFALIAGTIFFLAKLLADSIEQVPDGPRLAIRSSGAGPAQQVATGLVPPAMPTMVGHALYMLDINFRSSTVLGIVGAGGIGVILQQSIQTLAYRTTCAIIILTFVVVLAIEQLATFLRRLLSSDSGRTRDVVAADDLRAGAMNAAPYGL
jgi:phosphonate transport system permease protein